MTTQNLLLSDVLAVLRRRRRLLAASIVVVTAVALVISLSQSKKYEATAGVLVRTIATDTAVLADPNAQAAFYAERQLRNHLRMVESPDVQDAVSAKYDGDLDVDDVEAEASPDGSDAIEISITGPDAEDAAALVNLYARTYIDTSAKLRSDALKAGEDALRAQIAELDEQRAQIAAPLAAVRDQLAVDPNNGGLWFRSTELNAQLTPQLAAIDGLRLNYAQRLQNLLLSADLTGLHNAALVTEAEPASDPVSPTPVRDGIIGIMFGIGLGVALALGREFGGQRAVPVAPEAPKAPEVSETPRTPRTRKPAGGTRASTRPARPGSRAKS